ncbi:MAG: hypothetical protein QX191_10010 [Methylococcaceae bacterium]
MKLKFYVFLILLLVSSNLWAYGSSSSSKSCTKPEFSQFIPAENSTIAAGASFSFLASANTYPTTIKVTVKGLPVELSITPKDAAGFLVKGTLPKALHDDFARISINAEGQKNCKGDGGWLVNIAK